MNNTHPFSSLYRPALSMALVGLLNGPGFAAPTAPDKPLAEKTPVTAPVTETNAPDAKATDDANTPKSASKGKTVSSDGTKGAAPKTPSETSPKANDASVEEGSAKPPIAVPNTPTPPADANALNPKANPLSDQVPVAPPAPPMPAEKAAQAAQTAPTAQEKKVSALETLVSKGVMSAEMQANPDKPVTRAELAEILVKALKHNIEMYELFPFYRDVPRTHPDYVAIEVARETSLLTFQEDHGFYYPGRAVHYSELYQAIAHALTGPNPLIEEQEHLLQPFGGIHAMPSSVAPAVAKMARLRFFVTGTGHMETHLNLNGTVTPSGLAPLVSSLVHVIELRSTAVDDSENDLSSVLPGGLNLVLSPSTAIFESQLTPGQHVFFSLSEGVSPLPKESRVRALVRDVATSLHRYTLFVDEIRTPEGVVYKTQATLMINFPPRRRTNFIVPGQLLQTVSEALPIPKESKKPISNMPEKAPASSKKAATGVPFVRPELYKKAAPILAQPLPLGKQKSDAVKTLSPTQQQKSKSIPASQPTLPATKPEPSQPRLRLEPAPQANN